MIRARNLSRIFDDGGEATAALTHVDLDVDRGEFVAVMGPSGCGKTTLLNILGLLDDPSSGEYRFQGEDVLRLEERARARLRKASIGFVFQSFNLIDELTVCENVELPLLQMELSSGERKRRTVEALEKMEIMAYRSRFPHQISGGQRQRAAIARAVAAGPKLILADEPTGNLDSASGKDVMELLGRLNGEGTTVVMVTHSPEYAEYAGRRVHMLDGQILLENIGRDPRP